MNLRDIKKDIEYVLGAFIEDCSVAATIGPKAAEAGIAELMDEAVDLYNDLKDQVNAKVEGSKKSYFEALRKDILAKTNALYEKLSAVIKEAAAAEAEPAKKPAAKKAPAKKAAKKEEAPAE